MKYNIRFQIKIIGWGAEKNLRLNYGVGVKKKHIEQQGDQAAEETLYYLLPYPWIVYSKRS